MMRNLVIFVVVAVVGVALPMARRPVTGLYKDPDVRTVRGTMRMHHPLTANVYNIGRHPAVHLEVIVRIQLTVCSFSCYLLLEDDGLCSCQL